jgi:hypothetical protein
MVRPLGKANAKHWRGRNGRRHLAFGNSRMMISVSPSDMFSAVIHCPDSQ